MIFGSRVHISRLFVRYLRRKARPEPPLLPGSLDTYVLQRRNDPPLLDRSRTPETFPRVTEEQKLYDVLNWPSRQKLPSIDLILTDYVPGFGCSGDLVSVELLKAHEKLLLPKYAVYDTPDNREKYAAKEEDKKQHSSMFSALTRERLSRMILAVTMNMHHEWTLQSWHVLVCFRKAGYVVPAHCLIMPSRPITGPDIERLQGRTFLVTVIISLAEHVLVRCRIHHVTSEARSRIPYRNYHWAEPSVPLFEEDAEILKTLPAVPAPTNQEESD